MRQPEPVCCFEGDEAVPGGAQAADRVDGVVACDAVAREDREQDADDGFRGGKVFSIAGPGAAAAAAARSGWAGAQCRIAGPGAAAAAAARSGWAGAQCRIAGPGAAAAAAARSGWAGAQCR